MKFILQTVCVVFLLSRSACAELITIDAGSSPDLLFSANATTGVLSNPRSTAQNTDIVGLAFDSNSNTVFGITQFDTLVTVDVTSGAATSVGSVGVNSGGYGLAFDPNAGILYASDPISRELWTISTATAARTVIGTTSDRIVGLAFDSSSSILYGVSNDSDSLFTIDTSTANSTQIGSGLGISGGVTTSTGLAFDSALGQLFLSRSNSTDDGLYQVDTTTGLATRQGGFGLSGNFSGLTSVSAVPEPCSLSLASLIGFGALSRRRLQNWRRAAKQKN